MRAVQEALDRPSNVWAQRVFHVHGWTLVCAWSKINLPWIYHPYFLYFTVLPSLSFASPKHTHTHTQAGSYGFPRMCRDRGGSIRSVFPPHLNVKTAGKEMHAYLIRSLKWITATPWIKKTNGSNAGADLSVFYSVSVWTDCLTLTFNLRKTRFHIPPASFLTSNLLILICSLWGLKGGLIHTEWSS